MKRFGPYLLFALSWPAMAGGVKEMPVATMSLGERAPGAANAAAPPRRPAPNSNAASVDQSPNLQPQVVAPLLGSHNEIARTMATLLSGPEITVQAQNLGKELAPLQGRLAERGEAPDSQDRLPAVLDSLYTGARGKDSGTCVKADINPGGKADIRMTLAKPARLISATRERLSSLGRIALQEPARPTEIRSRILGSAEKPANVDARIMSMGIVIGLAALALYLGVIWMAPILGWQFNSNYKSLLTDHAAGKVVVFMMLSIGSVTIEEVIFRGMTYGAVRNLISHFWNRTAGILIAGAFSIAIFTAIHETGDLVMIGARAAVAMFLTYAYERFGRDGAGLFAAGTAHLTINYGMLIPMLLAAWGIPYWPALAIAGALLAGFAALLWRAP